MTLLHALPALLKDEIEASDIVRHLRDEQHALPAMVAGSDPATLAKMIRKIGLDESAPLVEFMSAEQLRLVLSQDLWDRREMGGGEVFNVARALHWMRTWLDVSPTFLLDKVEDAGKDFLAVIILNIAHVYRIDLVSWNYFDVNEDDRNFFDDADSEFRHTYGDYNVVAKRPSEKRWMHLNDILDALLHEDADFLNDVLELCSNRTDPTVGDELTSERDGALEAEEVLRDELGDSRDTERERAGFVLFQQAVETLHRARQRKVLLSAAGPAATVSGLVLTGRNGDAASAFRLQRALQLIGQDDPVRGAALQRELAHVANVLMSGCHIKGRRFEEQEALAAVFATASISFGFRQEGGLQDDDFGDAMLLRQQGLAELFEEGVSLLFENVSLPAARAVDAALQTQSLPGRLWQQYLRATRQSTTFEQLLLTGKFREVEKALTALEMSLLIVDYATVQVLLCEFSLMPLWLDDAAALESGGVRTRFVNSPADIRRIQQYIAGLKLE